MVVQSCCKGTLLTWFHFESRNLVRPEAVFFATSFLCRSFVVILFLSRAILYCIVIAEFNSVLRKTPICNVGLEQPLEHP